MFKTSLGLNGSYKVRFAPCNFSSKVKRSCSAFMTSGVNVPILLEVGNGRSCRIVRGSNGTCLVVSARRVPVLSTERVSSACNGVVRKASPRYSSFCVFGEGKTNAGRRFLHNLVKFRL